MLTFLLCTGLAFFIMVKFFKLIEPKQKINSQEKVAPTDDSTNL